VVTPCKDNCSVLAHVENPADFTLVRSFFAKLVACTRNYPYTSTLAFIMKKSLLLLIFVLIITNLSAQDTLVFSQENSAMFSNKYMLYPKSNTFEHKYMTDDLQIWYGKGTYEIRKRKIILSFGDSEKDIKKTNQITKIYDNQNITDSLTIVIYDEKYGQSIAFIKKNGKTIYSDFDGIIKISKDDFRNEENPIIEAFIQGSDVNIELTSIAQLKTIKISAYDIYRYYHFESNFERILKYKNNQLESNDYYNTTNNRKVKFELEK